MTYTFDATIYSDLYKDAFGYRPNMQAWNAMSDDEKQAEWDSTLYYQELVMRQESDEKILAQKEFERQISISIKLGAPSRKDAIRWVLQGDESNMSDYDTYEFEYAFYQTGIDWSIIPMYREEIAR